MKASSFRFADDLLADVRYALRTLTRSPGFAIVALFSLALGIGANTLVFSVVNATVLKPLPIPHPEQLFFVQSPRGFPSHSFPNYLDFRDRNVTFAGLIGYRVSPMNVEIGGAPVRAWGYLATGNYFDVLDVKPLVGRFFHQEEDRRPGASPFVVLSYDCWLGRFGGDTGVVGATVRINRLPYTVLGVTPKGFYGTEVFYRPDFWVPMMMQAQIEVGNPWLENRQTHNTWVSGRLKPGVMPAQAAANLNAIAAELAREYPTVNEGLKVQLGRPGLLGNALRGPVEAFTVGVLLLASLVLVVACANLASMLTARGADRARELAIRVSIGAARGRLVRQLVTETMLLAIAGGAAGWMLAAVGARTLSAWRLPADLPIQFDVHADTLVMLFAFCISTLAGLVFAVAPARQAARMDPNVALKDGAPTGPIGRLAVRDVLVSLQMTLCFVLVAASLLSLRGLQAALTMPLGFEPRGVSVIGFELGLAGYNRDEGERFRRRVLEEVTRLPGVRAASYSNSVPLSIDESTSIVFAEDRPTSKPSDGLSAYRYEVSPGFFQTLGMRMTAGRDLDWRDTTSSPRVAVVNETFARRVLGADNAVGRRFFYGWSRTNPVEVVGVVSDGKYASLTESPRAAVFDPILQAYNTTTTLIVRASRPEEEMVAEMRRVVAAIDPAMPLYQSGSLEQMLAFPLFPSRAAAVALGAFGLLALVLSATGIHGLVAYGVARRQREIGIRIAIGASRLDVLRLVLKRMTLLFLVGGAAGLVLALVAGRILASIVYQASPRDPIALAGVAVTMLAVGIVAIWAPARRSLRIDPVNALRAE